MIINNKFICNGCNEPICDPYILEVDNRKWHYSCLKCNKCKCSLNDKCWFKENKFYCKDDYNELIQQMTTCTVCKKSIDKNTLKYTIYNKNVHVNCLQCIECDELLKPGDKFFVISLDKFVCSIHYQKYSSKLESKKNEKYQINQLNTLKSNEPALNLIDHHLNNSINHLDQHYDSMNLIDYSNFSYLNDNLEENPASDYSSFLNNYWTQINSPLNEKQCKNKIRRKKLQTNLRNESDSNFNSFDSLNEQDLNDSINNFKNIDLISSSSNHNQNSNSSSASSSINSDFSNSSNSSTNFSSKITSSLKLNQRNQLKTKRNRTSFKAYQLTELKNYFSTNQNPDSKELAILSQQIKIHKRVLQVWFQNSRASFRKKNKTCYNPQFKNYDFSKIL